MSDVLYRRFEESDRHTTYEIFRESIHDYVVKIGNIAPDTPNNVSEAWSRQAGLMLHLEENADEDWVAVDDAGNVLGWARTIVRNGHAQLTHFFVGPGTQGRGVGAGLIERAFSSDLAPTRSVLATQHPGALSLYLRTGVSFRGLSFTFEGTPARRPSSSDLAVERASPGTALVDTIVALEEEILGFRRPAEIGFLVQDRPTYLLRRGGTAVGYVFGSEGLYMGPGGTLDPADFPEVLRVAESSAVENGVEYSVFTLPAAAASGVSWLLESGYRIDPFYEVLLSTSGDMKLDRYLMTEPSFIW